MLRIGWFSTGRDEAARQLLETVGGQIRNGLIQGRIDCVFSNREPGESAESDRFFQLVERYGIPLVTFSYEKFKRSRAGQTAFPESGWPRWRADYDREIMQRLEAFPVDLCVLAGYMLIVGPEMCARHNLLNLHPAVPGGPTGAWQEVMWKLIETRADRAGAMMHLATARLDRGPVVAYASFPIKGPAFAEAWAGIGNRSLDEIKRTEGERNSLFRLIREHELARELPLIVMTLKAIADARVAIRDGKVYDARGRPISGCDLSHEIEEIAGQGK